MATATVWAWVAVMARAGVSTDGVNEPWSSDGHHPVLNVQVAPSTPATSMGRACSLLWLHTYQHYFSVVLTSHCPLYPSCSNFSIQAVRKHGALRGITLTADRLIHEWSATLEARVITVNGRKVCYDPVELSDFWWSDK